MSAAETNLHGVAIAVGDVGLLILGESSSGKSALAARMIADWPPARVRLVADDRVLVQRIADRLVARPHAAIAGHLEVRGLGIVAPPTLESVVLRAVLKLEKEHPPRLPEAGFPMHRLLGVELPGAWLPAAGDAYARLLAIWPYLRRGITIGTNLGATP